MLTLNRVNKEIAARGLDMELCKGKDYFYFWGNHASTDMPGVYTYRLNDLTLDRWLEEAEERNINK